MNQTLTQCGEMERWDRENNPAPIQDAKQAIIHALRATPPSDGHCKLSRALRTLNED